MSRFRNLETGVVVSVDDAKDERFASGYEPADQPEKPARTARKASGKADAPAEK